MPKRLGTERLTPFVPGAFKIILRTSKQANTIITIMYPGPEQFQPINAQLAD